MPSSALQSMPTIEAMMPQAQAPTERSEHEKHLPLLAPVHAAAEVQRPSPKSRIVKQRRQGVLGGRASDGGTALRAARRCHWDPLRRFFLRPPRSLRRSFPRATKLCHGARRPISEVCPCFGGAGDLAALTHCHREVKARLRHRAFERCVGSVRDCNVRSCHRRTLLSSARHGSAVAPDHRHAGEFSSVHIVSITATCAQRGKRLFCRAPRGGLPFDRCMPLGA